MTAAINLNKIYFYYFYICRCQASNSQGKARGHITLTGTAAMAVFEMSALGESTNSFNLTWSVASYSPITEFRLFFRPQPPLDNLHHKPIYQPDIQMNSIPKIVSLCDFFIFYM